MALTQIKSGALADDVVPTGLVNENQRTIDADYTIQTTMNALSVGPVSIDSGKTLTIPANSRYVVL